MDRNSSRYLSASDYDDQPVAQGYDNEQSVSRHGSRDIENQPPQPVLFLNGRKLKYLNVYQILYQAALKDNWKLAEPILKKDPSFARQKISDRGETVLHIAAAARSTRFLRELVKLMEVGDLELPNNDGSTAFCFAAASGLVEIAKAMTERNKNLPNIRGEDGVLPITMAALVGNKDMVSYLFEVTSLDVLQQKERFELLETTIQNEMYEVALNVFKKDRKLASSVLEGNVSVLYALSQKSLAISNQGGDLKRFIVGACSPVWRKFVSAISMARRQFIPWFKVQIIPEKYVLKKQAGLLLEELWTECQRSAEDKLLELVEKERLLHSAATAGNVEFLAVVIRNHPDLIWKVDDENRTIFHVAVLNREEKVFSLIRQIGAIKDLIILIVDNDGNNILHLAGKLGQPIRKQKIGQMEVLKNKLLQSVPPNADNIFGESLQQLFREIEIIRHIMETQSVKEEEKIMPPSFLRVSGAALQMQREILWFKEVEKIVPPSLHKMINKDGKTPRQLFTEEHKLLLKEGERWMKDTANSCMIVATLIATMVFAAGFTVPGGNNSDNGIPVLLKLNGFTVFVISDAMALFSSIVSIIMFLSILTSRYAEDDFLVSLPAKLLFGLTTVFVSIVSMLLAFAATFFLIYSNHTGWEPKLTAACAAVPVALFACLQYKLWFDVVKSTYWSKFLFRQGKHSLY
ncbi:putative protein isoform X1 [Capsicum chacoense]|uniref:uncharacterized protein LOC107858923 isoform X1 n=1 Tax=Capsicum annuum TaxID=4072 RepID=UPI001FB06F6B|nr:uncharacterized protein LOC107858923 isoform X1 [Capsicum annuum]KAF3641582.1 putative potassium transporter 11-like [Capsicum annuum]